eukprot:NODE_829_length_1310_cov_60.080888_g607_i0.p1 GENE.NODE_829_length_1310_cov_60.080888_g607_i0~~NODE_829_length_1310_cov_60.080888_g607_i0.p1  ORF type:complete len:301 (+),score=52.31 NODE_829_length_1310_cov_60.080888_g607_i0:50-952(+)
MLCGMWWVLVLGTGYVACLSQPQHTALMKFYDATGGQYRTHPPWNGSEACLWHGVVCDTSNTHVLRLSLVHCNLSGVLPDLSALQQLTHMVMSQNHLEGPVPEWLQQIKGLASLDLSENILNGTIPPWLGSMQSLQMLNLGLRHQLKSDGWLDRFYRGYSRTPFNTNNLVGTIPTELGMMGQLQVLNLGMNRLIGAIPSAICTALALRELNVKLNLLTGQLPRCLSALPRLEVLDVFRNSFAGPLPATLSSTLWFLNLGENQFDGPVPLGYSKLHNLQACACVRACVRLCPCACFLIPSY